MKTVVSALLALGLIAGTVAEANAVVCARGAYHAGCAGPHGAVVTHRGYGYHGAAVVRPGVHCTVSLRPSASALTAGPKQAAPAIEASAFLRGRVAIGSPAPSEAELDRSERPVHPLLQAEAASGRTEDS